MQHRTADCIARQEKRRRESLNACIRRVEAEAASLYRTARFVDAYKYVHAERGAINARPAYHLDRCPGALREGDHTLRGGGGILFSNRYMLRLSYVIRRFIWRVKRSAKKKRESRDRRAKNAAKRGREDEETTTSGCSLLDENDEVKKQKVEEEPTKEDTEEAVAVT